MAGVPALLHAPLPLEVAGVAAAIALAAKSPELYASLREQAPWLDTWLSERRREELSIEPSQARRFFQAFVYGQVRRQAVLTPEPDPVMEASPVGALTDPDGHVVVTRRLSGDEEEGSLYLWQNEREEKRVSLLGYDADHPAPL